MAVAIESVHKSGDTGSESGRRLCSVVRQAILDRRGRVHAYELRFRGDRVLDGADANNDLLEVIANFGLEKSSELKKLTGKLTAFVRCSMELLSERLAQVLPASLTILEIVPSQEVSPELVDSCREMKALGFRFALGEFSIKAQTRALVKLADYVKVDFARTPPEARLELLNALRDKGITIVAKGINSQLDYRKAREEGFTLFQGLYFCEPRGGPKKPPAARKPDVAAQYFEVPATESHGHAQGESTGDARRPLTYQLLRLVNSPLWGMRQNVASIEVALVAVGREFVSPHRHAGHCREFNGDQPAELLCMAILRGRICEVMASKRGLDPFGQFCWGCLSLLPAMQGQPMSEVIPTLPLGAEILEALLGKRMPRARGAGLAGKFRARRLGSLRCRGQGRWLDQAELSNVYMDARGLDRGRRCIRVLIGRQCQSYNSIATGQSSRYRHNSPGSSGPRKTCQSGPHSESTCASIAPGSYMPDSPYPDNQRKTDSRPEACIRLLSAGS